MPTLKIKLTNVTKQWSADTWYMVVYRATQQKPVVIQTDDCVEVTLLTQPTIEQTTTLKRLGFVCLETYKE